MQEYKWRIKGCVWAVLRAVCRLRQGAGRVEVPVHGAAQKGTDSGDASLAGTAEITLFLGRRAGLFNLIRTPIDGNMKSCEFHVRRASECRGNAARAGLFCARFDSAARPSA
jgi:hypothetical protein